MGERELQVESYIPGREFAVEGMITGGKLQPIAIFDKPDPMEGPFFEETIYVTPSREPAEVQAALIETTARAAAALGLRHGPVHAELRYNAGRRVDSGGARATHRRIVRARPTDRRWDSAGGDDPGARAGRRMSGWRSWTGRHRA